MQVEQLPLPSPSPLLPPHVLELLANLAKGMPTLNAQREDEKEDADDNNDEGISVLECPICFELPGGSDTNGISIVTPCGHGPICEKCFWEACQQQNDEKDGSGKPVLACPICREPAPSTGLFRVLANADKPGAYRALLKEEASALEKKSTGQASGDDADDDKDGANDDALPERPTVSDLRSGRVALHSAKLDAMVEKLRAELGIYAGPALSSSSSSSSYAPPAHAKAVIFTQWTHMLDLVEFVLRREKISCVRLDGSLNQRERQSRLRRFRSRPDVKVMIMSLKVGSLGLNLTCASFVILLDPWWNPAVEEQAINRVHRLGQTRNVRVCRFTIANTCEQRLIALQRTKASLSSQVLSDAGSIFGDALGQKNSISKLTVDDLTRFWAD
jgi:SNF2 family DNA or RNA helicase